jgi:hypothetical protein
VIAKAEYQPITSTRGPGAEVGTNNSEHLAATATATGPSGQLSAELRWASTANTRR